MKILYFSTIKGPCGVFELEIMFKLNVKDQHTVPVSLRSNKHGEQSANRLIFGIFKKNFFNPALFTSMLYLLLALFLLPSLLVHYLHYFGVTPLTLKSILECNS